MFSGGGDRRGDLKWVNFSVDKSSCHKALGKERVYKKSTKMRLRQTMFWFEISQGEMSQCGCPTFMI